MVRTYVCEDMSRMYVCVWMCATLCTAVPHIAQHTIYPECTQMSVGCSGGKAHRGPPCVYVMRPSPLLQLGPHTVVTLMRLERRIDDVINSKLASVHEGLRLAPAVRAPVTACLIRLLPLLTSALPFPQVLVPISMTLSYRLEADTPRDAEAGAAPVGSLVRVRLSARFQDHKGPATAGDPCPLGSVFRKIAVALDPELFPTDFLREVSAIPVHSLSRSLPSHLPSASVSMEHVLPWCGRVRVTVCVCDVREVLEYCSDACVHARACPPVCSCSGTVPPTRQCTRRPPP